MDAAARERNEMLECVPNVSEGRDGALLTDLATACGPSLLDVHADHDHHRCVITLAGPGLRDAETAVASLARTVASRIDLSEHEGVHPRLGVIDVVPFIALDEDHELAADAALAFADWLVGELEVPVFLYDDADPKRRSLPELRRDAFVKRGPDLGPRDPHPQLGATAVGARPPLVAVNCWLDTNDLIVARNIARDVREVNGGLPGVRALALYLESQGVVQVSMNLVDLPVTGLEVACSAVRLVAGRDDFDVTKVEIVGLMPAAELARCSDEFREWAGLSEDQTIEARLAARDPADQETADQETADRELGGA
jgi:glutamate formiminotransferase